MSQGQGETEEIDGKKFTVYALPPRVSFRHSVKIGKIIGPALASVADAANAKGGKGLDTKIDVEKIVEMVMSDLDEVYLEKLLDDFMSVTSVDPGGDLTKCYDAIFRGRPGLQFRWLVFAFRHEYSTFFDDLGAAFSLLGTRGPLA